MTSVFCTKRLKAQCELFLNAKFHLSSVLLISYLRRVPEELGTEFKEENHFPAALVSGDMSILPTMMWYRPLQCIDQFSPLMIMELKRIPC